jgi:hypothetical protein
MPRALLINRTAVETFDVDSFIGAENSYNLFTLKRNSEAATDDERSRLEISGMFHLGDFVNKFRHGIVSKILGNLWEKVHWS